MSNAGILDALRDRKSHHGTIMAISMMKDEAPYLIEWFAHHLALGFTDILVYTNDCTDGTVEILQRLEELGLGYHRENRIREGIKPQPSAIKHAQVEPLVAASDWAMLFDADEYLCLNHPSGHLDGMLDDVVARGANGIVITWRIFGSGGVVDWSRAPVTEQYLRSAPPLWNKGWGVKTLFKFDPEYWKLGIHRPTIKKKHLEAGFADKVHWLNGSGLPMEEYFKFRGWRSIRRTLGHDWAQLNHYAVKSIDAYAVRKFRGNVNNKKDKYNAEYWSLQDRNEVQDRNILRHAPERERIMSALLEDPVLNRLHFAALERVETKLVEYKQTDAYQQLRQSLMEASKVSITEVEANPPKPRDPAKIAELMSKAEMQVAGKKVAQRIESPQDSPPGWAEPGVSPYVTTKIDLSEDITTEWIDNQGILLPADTRIYSPVGLNALIMGKFGRRHARNIVGCLEGAARLVELGAGTGFLAMKVLTDFPELTVMAQDSRPGMISAARWIAAKNGMEDTARLKLTDGPLCFPSDSDGQASGLAAILRDFCPDALQISEASITPDQIGSALPASLERIIFPVVGQDATDKTRALFGPVIEDAGFKEDPERVESGLLYWMRQK